MIHICHFVLAAARREQQWRTARACARYRHVHSNPVRLAGWVKAHVVRQPACAPGKHFQRAIHSKHAPGGTRHEAAASSRGAHAPRTWPQRRARPGTKTESDPRMGSRTTTAAAAAGQTARGARGGCGYGSARLVHLARHRCSGSSRPHPAGASSSSSATPASSSTPSSRLNSANACASLAHDEGTL